MTIQVISGCECCAEPREVENSSGICGCWEDAVRDRDDIGWCWKTGEVFQKLVKAFAVIFLLLWMVCVVLYYFLKIRLDIFNFAI